MRYFYTTQTEAPLPSLTKEDAINFKEEFFQSEDDSSFFGLQQRMSYFSPDKQQGNIASNVFIRYGEKRGDTFLGSFIRAVDYTSEDMKDIHGSLKYISNMLSINSEIATYKNAHGETALDIVASCSKMHFTLKLGIMFEIIGLLSIEHESKLYMQSQPQNIANCTHHIKQLIYVDANQIEYKRYGEEQGTSLHSASSHMILQSHYSQIPNPQILSVLLCYAPGLLHIKNASGHTALSIPYKDNAFLNKYRIASYNMLFPFIAHGLKLTETFNTPELKQKLLTIMSNDNGFIHPSLIMNLIIVVLGRAFERNEAIFKHTKNYDHRSSIMHGRHLPYSNTLIEQLRGEIDFILHQLVGLSGTNNKANFIEFIKTYKDTEGNNILDAVILYSKKHLEEKHLIQIIEMFVKAGLDINKRNYLGDTPLHSAILNEYSLEAIKKLISLGADVNATDSQGATSLYHAVTMQNVELIKLLINKGADINACDSEGNTPLFRIILKEKTDIKTLDIIKLLIELGAKTDIANNSGITPKKYALKTDKEKVYNLLCAENEPSFAELASEHYLSSSEESSLSEDPDNMMDIDYTFSFEVNTVVNQAMRNNNEMEYTRH